MSQRVSAMILKKMTQLVTKPCSDGQKGYAAIGAAAAISLGSFGIIQGIQKQKDLEIAAKEGVIHNLSYQEANERALELATQLLGNSAVVVSLVDPKDPNKGYKFKRGSGYKTSKGSVAGDAMRRSYYISNNELRIPACGISKISPGRKRSAYRRGGNKSWLDRAAYCARHIETRIRAGAFANPTSSESLEIQGQSERKYVLVDSTTASTSGFNGDKNKISRKARLLYADPARTCQSNAESEGSLTGKDTCKVDHCKYMYPLRDSEDNVMYHDDGKMKLMGFPLFKGIVRFPVNGAGSMIVGDVNNNDPKPTQLVSFLNEAYEPGLRDPFDGWQGIMGRLESKNLISRQGNDIVLDMSNFSGKTSSLIRFDGFLYCWNGDCPKGADAKPWVTGKTYDELKYALREGCHRTTHAYADYCTRVNLTYALDQYSYPKRRRCHYRGPEKRKGSYIYNGLRKYEVDSNLVEIEDWKEISKKEYHSYNQIVADDRSPYRDFFPHHYIHKYRKPATVTKTHDFSDIKVGTVVEWEYKKIEEAQKVDKKDDKKEGKKDTKKADKKDGEEIVQIETYFRRKVVSTFVVDCKVEEVPTSIQKHYSAENRASSCYYMSYYDVLNRNSCNRQVAWAAHCRNSNGCFTAGTPIQMADGRTKPIEEVKQGDWVQSPNSGKPMRVASTVVGDQKRELYEVKYEGSSEALTASWNHPWYTERGIMQSKDLKVGDRLLGADSTLRKVTQIRKIPKKDGVLVFNLNIDTQDARDHNYIAGDVISGDYYMQNQLTKGQDQDFASFDAFMREKGK